jgi:hypothetical protein
MIVYPLNPKSAQAYRERKAPSGVKDDRLDAWSFADALRVVGQDWKALRPEAFEDWTSVSAWEFLQRFPTPESLAQAWCSRWN